MKLFGKAESVARMILEQFQCGNLPRALAPVFLQGKSVPCSKWSWTNRLLVAIAGFSDARGVRQWNAIGRKVKPGAKAISILVPCFVPAKEDADEFGKLRHILIGFRSVPVFGLQQTEGRPVTANNSAETFIESLPLREVARAWGLQVSSFDGQDSNTLGWFAPGSRAIAVGVTNLSTWCHELVHAADHRIGTLTESGQHWASETVAELGAATLLCVLGKPLDADLGGAVTLILTTADELNSGDFVRAA